MSRTDKYTELRKIADAVIDEQASPEQIQQLDVLLSDDPEAQLFYYDYIGMHIQLAPKVERKTEFVYRRMTEEFIMRSADDLAENSASKKTLDPQDVHSSQAAPALINGRANNQPPLKRLFNPSLIIIALLSLLLILFWQRNNEESSTVFIANILQGQLTISDFGQINENQLQAGKYQAPQGAKLQLSNGKIISLTPHSEIKIFGNHELTLYRGAIDISGASQEQLIVHGPSFSLYSTDDNLSLDLSAQHPIVTSGNNTLLAPTRWRPRHYWSFDGQGNRAIDSAGNADGIAQTDASRTQGLLGSGAFYFDNSINSRLDLGAGGGVAPATGSFAVTDGVTIEVLIKPEYSGKFGDGDNIFAKSHTDKPLRMFLAFRHDKFQHNLMPKGDFNESLSFGLYIVGQGYHALKLPLDGLDGRPSLAKLKDGKAHHIIASYNVSTGVKAIYIDGIQYATYQYPAGSKLLTGGSGKANIGHNPSRPRQPSRKKMTYYNEAFAGTIDEVAFYDFALPQFMIEHHINQIQQGLNYYGLPPSTEPLPKQLKIALPNSTKIVLDSLTGLPRYITKD